MTANLKPCAHCGSTDIAHETFEEDRSRDFVMCNGCGIFAQRDDCQADPVEVWNCRTDSEAAAHFDLLAASPSREQALPGLRERFEAWHLANFPTVEFKLVMGAYLVTSLTPRPHGSFAVNERWKAWHAASEAAGKSSIMEQKPAAWAVGLDLFHTLEQAERNIRNPDIKPVPLFSAPVLQVQGMSETAQVNLARNQHESIAKMSRMELVMRALRDAREIAMHNTAAAPIPECGDFGRIAQNLDWAINEIERAEAAISEQSLISQGMEQAVTTNDCSHNIVDDAEEDLPYYGHTWPPEIWLQHGCSEVPNYASLNGEGITWCADNIDKYDVKYVRSDLTHIETVAQPVSGCSIDLEKIDKMLRAAFKARDLETAMSSLAEIRDWVSITRSAAASASAGYELPEEFVRKLAVEHCASCAAPYNYEFNGDGLARFVQAIRLGSPHQYRDLALEEAAKLCDFYAKGDMLGSLRKERAKELGIAIRALKSTSGNEGSAA